MKARYINEIKQNMPTSGLGSIGVGRAALPLAVYRDERKERKLDKKLLKKKLKEKMRANYNNELYNFALKRHPEFVKSISNSKVNDITLLRWNTPAIENDQFNKLILKASHILDFYIVSECFIWSPEYIDGAIDTPEDVEDMLESSLSEIASVDYHEPYENNEHFTGSVYWNVEAGAGKMEFAEEDDVNSQLVYIMKHPKNKL